MTRLNYHFDYFTSRNLKISSSCVFLKKRLLGSLSNLSREDNRRKIPYREKLLRQLLVPSIFIYLKKIFSNNNVV